MNHIPYKGGGAALNDLLAHQVDVYFAATASALPMVKAGKLAPAGGDGGERIAALPDVPTVRRVRGSRATTSRSGTASSDRRDDRPMW